VTYDSKILLASIVVVILCITDYILTFWGLRISAINEANPIMLPLLGTPNLLLLMKVFLPIALGVLSWNSRNRSRRLVINGLGLALITYTFVTMLHVYWIVVVLFK